MCGQPQDIQILSRIIKIYNGLNRKSSASNFQGMTHTKLSIQFCNLEVIILLIELSYPSSHVSSYTMIGSFLTSTHCTFSHSITNIVLHGLVLLCIVFIEAISKLIIKSLKSNVTHSCMCTYNPKLCSLGNSCYC